MSKVRWPIFIFFVLPALSARTQSPDTAALRGTVAGPNGTSLAGVRIVIVDSQNQTLRSLTTGAQGTFAAEELPAAQQLRVQASYSGLSDVQSDPLVLTAGSTASVQIQMALPSVKAQVAVMGASDEVRTDEPQLGESLSVLQIQATPLPNRRITYLPLLNAANRQAINQGDVFMNQDLFTANGTGRRQA